MISGPTIENILTNSVMVLCISRYDCVIVSSGVLSFSGFEIKELVIEENI